MITAHNAQFEQAVLGRMGIDIPSDRFVDSAVLARLLVQPASWKRRHHNYWAVTRSRSGTNPDQAVLQFPVDVLS